MPGLVVVLHQIPMSNVAERSRRWVTSPRARRTSRSKTTLISRKRTDRDDNHRSAAQAVLAADRRNLGPVDCASLRIMRKLSYDPSSPLTVASKDQGFEALSPNTQGLDAA